jgi:hypothetical protein
MVNAAGIQEIAIKQINVILNEVKNLINSLWYETLRFLSPLRERIRGEGEIF